MNQKKFLAITLGVAAAIVLVVIGSMVYRNKKDNTPKIYKFTQTDAPKGKVVDGFPKELLLGQTAVKVSYSLVYENRLKQYTAEYTSTKSSADLYNSYIDMFKKAHDLVGNNVLDNQGARMYVATPKNETINIVIDTPDKKSRHVIVSYTQK